MVSMMQKCQMRPSIIKAKEIYYKCKETYYSTKADLSVAAPTWA